MNTLGRKIHASAALSWSDFWDSMTMFAARLNTIGRHALKAASMLRTHWERNAMLRASSHSESSIDVNYTVNTFVYNTNESAVARAIHLRMVEISSEHRGFKPYIVTYTVEVEWSTSTVSTATSGTSICGWSDLYVDGRAAPDGNDMVCRHASAAPATDNYTLSGLAIVQLLPGKHTIDLSVALPGSFNVKTVEASIVELGL